MVQEAWRSDTGLASPGGKLAVEGWLIQQGHPEFLPLRLLLGFSEAFGNILA